MWTLQNLKHVCSKTNHRLTPTLFSLQPLVVIVTKFDHRKVHILSNLYTINTKRNIVLQITSMCSIQVYTKQWTFEPLLESTYFTIHLISILLRWWYSHNSKFPLCDKFCFKDCSKRLFKKLQFLISSLTDFQYKHNKYPFLVISTAVSDSL